MTVPRAKLHGEDAISHRQQEPDAVTDSIPSLGFRLMIMSMAVFCQGSMNAQTNAP